MNRRTLKTATRFFCHFDGEDNKLLDQAYFKNWLCLFQEAYFDEATRSGFIEYWLKTIRASKARLMRSSAADSKNKSPEKDAEAESGKALLSEEELDIKVNHFLTLYSCLLPKAANDTLFMELLIP